MGKRKAITAPSVTKVIKVDDMESVNPGRSYPDRESSSEDSSDDRASSSYDESSDEDVELFEAMKAQMITLNQTFLGDCIQAVDESSAAILVPAVRDYLNRARLIFKMKSGISFDISKPITTLPFRKLAEFFEPKSTARNNKQSAKNRSINDSENSGSDESSEEKTGNGSSKFGPGNQMKMELAELEKTNNMFGSAKDTRHKDVPIPTTIVQPGIPPYEPSLFTFGIPAPMSGNGNHAKESISLKSSPIKNGFTPQFGELSKYDGLKNGFGPSTSSMNSDRSTGFSFTPLPTVPVAGSAAQKNETEEEEEPGEKYEIKPVVEADSLYSIRCKVFGMVGGQYKDKGVGQLYVKKLENSNHQVVVRADNNLGTILLNVILKEGLPLQKKSTKDVMIVDPLGDGGKPMTVLLRVKSEEDATTLLGKLQEFVKLSS